MKYRVFQDDYAKILYTDTLKTTIIKDETIDLIVTSSPYNLNIDYKSCNDNQLYDEYLEFTRN